MFLTCQKILERHEEWIALPDEEAFSNENKVHREMWCVAQFCEALQIQGEIDAPAQEPADVFLKYKNKIYEIQVAECRNEGPRMKPTDILSRKLANGMMAYTTGIPNLASKVSDIISAKANKNYAGSENLTLLIYVNMIASGLNDLKETDSLTDIVKTVPFKCIALIDNKQKVFFLKGDASLFGTL